MAYDGSLAFDTDTAGDGGGDGSPPNVLSILPGGSTPSPVERYVAFIILGALAFLIVIHRAFPRVG